MATQIQVRRGTASAWTTANPTLASGEPGFETDTGRFKVGDGATVWTSLPYAALSEVADDPLPALSAALDAGGFKITNLATPTAAGDAATKAYVDAGGGGGGGGGGDHGGLTGLTDPAAHGQYLLLDGSRPMEGPLNSGGFTVAGLPASTGNGEAVRHEQLAGYVPLAGGTMTGSLVLNGSPDSDLKAATKAYVDTAVANVDPGAFALAAGVAPVTLGIACSDEQTNLTTGDSKAVIRMPHAMTVSSVRAGLTTASSSGLVTVNIRVNGSDILSTPLTIDATEKSSTTAATAAVLSTTAIPDDAEIAVDIDGAGSGAKGLEVWLIGTTDAAVETTRITTKTTDYTAAIADLATVIQFNSTVSRTFTIPPQATVPWPDGAVFGVRDINTGTVVVAAGSGVTIRQQENLPDQWDEAYFHRIGLNEWVQQGPAGPFSDAKTHWYAIALSDETTELLAATNVATFALPFACTLLDVFASVGTVSSSGDLTVDINEAGTTVLSTKLTIDANEKTSGTAAAAAVISDPDLAQFAELRFDIDAAGTGAKGLKVWLQVLEA